MQRICKIEGVFPVCGKKFFFRPLSGIRIRKLQYLLLLFLLLNGLQAFASGVDSDEGAMSSSKSKNLVYGGDYKFPPFEYLDEHGNPAGFHIDLINCIAKKNGWTISYKLGPWNEILQSFQDSSIQIIAAYRSAYRSPYASFTSAHALIFHRIFTRKGTPDIIDLDDIAGKSVIVQRGAYAHDFLIDHYPSATPILVASEQDALLLLSTGAYDCAIVSRIGGNIAIRNHGISNVFSASPILLPIEYCFAVGKQDSSLLAHLNEGLTQSKIEGDFDHLEQKWLNRYRKNPSDLFEHLLKVSWVIGGLLIILILVFSWGWSLRRQVERRTAEISRELIIRQKVEYELSQREKRLSSILKAAPVGIGVVSNRIITDVNDVVCKLTGYLREELIGQSARILYLSDEEFRRVGEVKYRSIAENGVGSIETIWLRKDGSHMNVLLSSSPIEINELGKGVTFIVVDISLSRSRARVDNS